MCKTLIALDLDGTVLHEDERVDDALQQALQQLDADANVELLFATGRSFDAAERIVQQLRLHPHWLVCCNGAVTMHRDADTGTFAPHKLHTFDPSIMLLRLQETLPDATVAVEGADGNFYYTSELPAKTLPNNRIRVDFAQLLQLHATRVVATSPAHSVAEFFAHVEQLGYAHTAYAVGDTAWLDAAPHGVNKGTALSELTQLLQISGEHVFVAGDGLNDLDMLQWARSNGGTAVAMGQSPAAVKNAAGYITGTIDEGGLLAAFKHFGIVA